MVATKRVIFTPCPPSPARDAADPKHEDWITSWIADLSILYPGPNTDVPGFAKALCKLGYDNHANLASFYIGDLVTYGGQECAQDQHRAGQSNRI